jgi:hypothetical protein
MWVRTTPYGVAFSCFGSCSIEPPYCNLIQHDGGTRRTCECGSGRETRCDAELRYEEDAWYHYCEAPDPCPGTPSCRDGDYNPGHDPPWPFHWVAVCCCL